MTVRNTYAPCQQCGAFVLYNPYETSRHALVSTGKYVTKVTCEDCLDKRLKEAREKNPTLYENSVQKM